MRFFFKVLEHLQFHRLVDVSVCAIFISSKNKKTHYFMCVLGH